MNGEGAFICACLRHLRSKTDNMQGKIIINTRPDGSEDRIGEALRELGATVLSMPLTEIIPVDVAQRTLSDITRNHYKWLVFTSKNGVDKLFDQLKLPITATTLPFKTAVFGQRTTIALRERGWNPDLVNTKNSADDLVNDLLPLLQPGERVLLVVGDLASDKMQEKLGAKVETERLNVYRTISIQTIDAKIIRRIARNEYDLILFTSPSGVNSFIHHTEGTIEMQQLKTAVIGLTTGKALLVKGITPLVVATPSGKEGLIKGIERYFK